MRLHLVIERHGLPVTRILWTTNAPGSQPPSLTPTASTYAAPSSAILTSSRHANTSFGANGPLLSSGSGGITIAQLLEDIDHVIPLQTVDPEELEYAGEQYSGQFWTLEDYVVEVSGSECLHFMEVDGLLRDGDEVVIRPLQRQEVQARRMTGRIQITHDGRHLIDGIPFGARFKQSAVRARPRVEIPPRKKRRLAYEGWGGDENEDEEQGQIEGGQEQEEEEYTDEGSEESEESEEPDEEYDDEPLLLEEAVQPAREEPSTTPSVQREEPREPDTARPALKQTASTRGPPEPAPEAAERATKKRRVGFTEESRPAVDTQAPTTAEAARVETEQVKGQTTEKAAAAAAATGEESSEESSDESSSEEESSSESESSSEESSSDEEEQEARPKQRDVAQAAAAARTPRDATEEDTAAVAAKQNPPGSGSRVTKYHNSRARMRRKLRRLKAMGLLGENARFDDLREWEATHTDVRFGPDGEIDRDSSTRAGTAREKKGEESALAAEKAEFIARREKLLRDIQGGGVDVSQRVGGEVEADEESQPMSESESESESEASGQDEAPEQRPIEKVPVKAFAPAPRAVQLNKSAKKPVTAAPVKQPQAVPTVQAPQPVPLKQPQPQPAPASQAPQPALSEKPARPVDFWKSRLTLGATECVYDHVELTAPPFPFKQRWDKEADSAIWAARDEEQNQKQKQNNKKRKRNQQQAAAAPEEKRQHVNAEEGDEDDIELDYGEDVAGEDVGTAQPNGKAQANGEPAEQDEEDLPPLPADMSSLPSLDKSHVKRGAVIAYRKFEISRDTNWLPDVSRRYYTARVESVKRQGDDLEIEMRLAKRDHPQPKGDDLDEAEEENVWANFEMPVSASDGEEGEEKDPGKESLLFSTLIEPKILVRQNV